MYIKYLIFNILSTNIYDYISNTAHNGYETDVSYISDKKTARCNTLGQNIHLNVFAIVLVYQRRIISRRTF